MQFIHVIVEMLTIFKLMVLLVEKSERITKIMRILCRETRKI